MKKIISILLITIAIFSLNHAYADDFSIRGGIRFGMSIEEVKKIEKEINGLNPSSTNSDELGYRIDCDFIEKSDYAVGLEIADAMKVHILWDAYDERDIIDGEVNFPLVPDHLAMVILTDGLHISQASWEVTSDHSLHVYFYKDDIEPFIESEVVYLIMLRYQDGLYYKLF